MKIKKLLLLLLMIVCITGCTKIKNLSYDEIVGNIRIKSKSPNTYRRGYKYFIPKGLSLNKAGTNYAIIESKDVKYYLFIDMINYINKNDINYVTDSHLEYSKNISYEGKKGYIEIKKYENEQYLIEIMYNYAKIEVMVDSGQEKSALINSISILKSIVYDDNVIESLLKDDSLTYTEEKFDMFSKSNRKSSILNYTEEEFIIDNDKEINDPDLVN